MKKVGIVSCYFKNNYGSALQAYATQKILDNNCIPNETINIDGNIDFKNGKKKYYLSQIFNIGFIKSKLGMIKMKFDIKLKKELRKNVRLRNEKYNQFKREFCLSAKCRSYKDLCEMAKRKYTDIIVGSDQLWLPVNVVADYYTLNWVPDGINKISYATSFGFSTLPLKYNNQYNKFLKKINHLSVREQSGVRLIKDIADLDAELVADPTILLTREEWERESTREKIYNEKYILCYFLGNNIQHRKFAERLKEETGCKIVSLNHADEYVKYSDKFCDYAPFNIGPREWINLINNADYVCTDSFHGTVFSILFNKIFFNFRRHSNGSKVSTNSRIDSLLKVAGISTERILKGTEDVKEVLKYKIDYEEVNQNISEFRENSKMWLLNSITWKREKENPHVEIEDKSECTGCTACKSICPNEAIEMKEDEEGFLYPDVDKEKCINCGLCKKVCPIINIKKEIKKEQSAFIINNKDLKVRKESTSGGAFSAIASYVIKNNGVVYGAAFNNDFEVIHKWIDKEENIKIFRNSKYVQSNLQSIFNEINNFLNEGRLVCFSGTPCQVEGLKAFLRKEYQNLVLVDVVCRAVPSPKFLRKYLQFISDNKLKREKIKNVSFRNKDKYGYKYTQMKISSDNYLYEEGVETDPYLRAFFRGYSIRPSCGECKFKKDIESRI